MKKLHLFFVLMIVVAINLQAQSNIRPSFHFGDMNFYNPANTLPLMYEEQKYYISAGSPYTFVKNEDKIWSNSPALTLNFIGKTKHPGLHYSAGLFCDIFSFFSRVCPSGGVIYKMEFGEWSSFSFGARVSVNFDIVRWNSLQLPIAPRQGTTLKLNPDLDLGVEYNWKNLSIGLASKNLIGFRTKIEDEVLIKNERFTSLSTSYAFDIGRHYQITPLVMLFFDNRMIYDVGARFSAYEFVHVSYMLRANELRSIIALEVLMESDGYVGLSIDFSPMLPDKNMGILVRYCF